MLVLAGCGGSSSGGDGSAAAQAPPPPEPPPLSAEKQRVFRFLNQATFGATDADADHLLALASEPDAYARWIDEQLAAEPSLQLAYVQASLPDPLPERFGMSLLNAQRQDIWFKNTLQGKDQLRQRVAWALSQIMVVSQSTLANYPFGLADYYDTLTRNAFGDFRKLLEDVSLHPMMGVYLSMLGNQKPNTARNIRPDENYARELMQLFTIGLVQLNPDGTVELDASNAPTPTYDQDVVEGFAHVFTGWKWACGAGSPASCGFGNTPPTQANQILPMQAFPEQHAPGAKELLAYPGARSSQPAGQSPQQDLDAALDNIFNHPNVGPFVGRALIQKLVTSNPSAEYVKRVSAVFDDDGTGKRGNLGAVVRAILLDAEARAAPSGATAGKLKEPLLRLTQVWRAFGGRAASGLYVSANPTRDFGEGPLTAPSVFNFFSPFYAPPGEIADQGLVAPELQIATEYQNTLIANIFYQQAFGRNSYSGGAGPDTIVIDVSAETPLAANPVAVVSAVGNKLLASQMSAPLRQQAEALVARAGTFNPAQRVAEAIWLVATSPEFATQR